MIKRYHCNCYRKQRQHLQLFVNAYSYGDRLKILRDLTPYEFSYQTWMSEPERFSLNLSDHILRSNS